MVGRGAGRDGERARPPGPWEDEAQAAAYAAFCARWPLYADTSAALAAAAGVAGADRVADLGCGTGETTRACLARLSREGQVLGLDPAPRMVAAASAAFSADPRARFAVGSAEHLPGEAPPGGFDRVVCNSAIWLDPDLPGALRALFAALRPGGTLALSLPAEYVGEVDHLVTPGAVTLATAVGEVRRALDPSPPAPARPAATPLPTSLEAWDAAVLGAGLSHLTVTRWGRRWPLDEAVAWLSQPVVAAGLLPGAPADVRARLAPELRARLPSDLPLETRWILLVASRPT